MTIRPYLPPPQARYRRQVPRRGRPPAADARARRDLAASIVRDDPAISGAELARRLGVDPSRGVRLLAEIRASLPDVPPPAPKPVGPGKTVRIPQRDLARLAAATGRPIGEDVAGQVAAVLDERDATRTAQGREREE